MLTARAAVTRAENAAIAAAERVVSGSRRRCPCCGWSGLAFRTFTVGGTSRRDVICPGCGSFERHRVLSYFYPAFFRARARRPRRLVHFAPEPALRHVLVGLADTYETSAYGESYPADHRFDLRALALPDASVDAMILHHVIDCLDDDRTVAREMFRVLTPGGVVVAVVTLADGVATRECETPQANSLHRTYGTVDVADRFAPFEIEIVDACALVPAADRRAIAAPARLPLLVLRRPEERA